MYRITRNLFSFRLHDILGNEYFTACFLRLKENLFAGLRCLGTFFEVLSVKFYLLLGRVLTNVLLCPQLLLRKKAAEELKKEQERKAAERRRIIEERCGKAKNTDDASEGTLKLFKILIDNT